MSAKVPLAQIVEQLLGRLHPTVTDAMKLDLLEGLSWMVDDETEFFDMRRDWVASGRDDLIDLALMRWQVLIANTYSEAARVLAPVANRPEYQGRAEERLADVERHLASRPSS